VAQAQNDLHLQTPGRIQHRLHIVLVEIQARGVHEVQDLPNAADALNVQVEDITLLARGVLKEAPEVLAEGGQHILVRFEADSPHHQHAVTKQALDSLLMQLLEEVAAVGSNRVHA
jgi:hypothetical protein